jgi:flagellar basal-body rod protein FlgG
VRAIAVVLCVAVASGCMLPRAEREAASVTANLRAEAAEASASRPAQAVLDDAVGIELMRAAVDLYAQRRRVALENLANVETVGWKRRMVRASTQNIVGPDGESYSLPVAVAVDPVFSGAPLELTGRNLDLAIDGEGYFAVVLADGRTGFTRAGVLQLDADGKLRDHEGRVLLPEITVPSDTLEIAIDPEGRVSCRTAGSPDTSTLLGQLMLHRFVNPAGMRNEGSAWLPCDASGQPTTGHPGANGLGLLKQGFRERSNVRLADELMQLQALDRQHLALLEVLRRSGMVVP